jgi:hypothetical protein
MPDEIKEDFCAACLTVPLAFIGAGTSAYGSKSKGTHKRKKKMLLWSGVFTVSLAVVIAVYYLFIAKCEECR